MRSSQKLPMFLRWGVCLLAVLLMGCSSIRPWVNAPLPDGLVPPDPDRVQALSGTASEDLSMVAAVTLSGGGARAAAFGYGVLQALHETPMVSNGRSTSLLDHIGLISGVSCSACKTP